MYTDKNTDPTSNVPNTKHSLGGGQDRNTEIQIQYRNTKYGTDRNTKPNKKHSLGGVHTQWDRGGPRWWGREHTHATLCLMMIMMMMPMIMMIIMMIMVSWRSLAWARLARSSMAIG